MFTCLSRSGCPALSARHYVAFLPLSTGVAAGDGLAVNSRNSSLAGHSSVSISERYVHLAAVAFPGAAEQTEAKLFAAVAKDDPE